MRTSFPASQAPLLWLLGRRGLIPVRKGRKGHEEDRIGERRQSRDLTGKADA
ncbi:hypothetical protein ABZ943_42260 [Streptomyces rubiginosohelvolus]|uniref:hypothetical protein n=1 Tax=Streptomyces rubiginosohelvolus TaxID=67362 RepID=UPI0033E3268E